MNRIDQAIRDAEGAVTRVMDKHTPGPWKAMAGPPEYARIDSTSMRDIARCPRAEDTETAEANAYLIAAAPEMLQALEAVMAVSFFDKWLESQPAYELMKNAIKKARGER